MFHATLFAELQEEVRRRLHWHAAFQLSMTCRAEHIACAPHMLPWPVVVRTEYQRLTRLRTNDALHDRTVLMTAARETMPWFRICPPTHCDPTKRPDADDVWPPGINVARFRWTVFRPYSYGRELRLEYAVVDDAIRYNVRYVQMDNTDTAPLYYSRLWKQHVSPLPHDDSACREMLRRVAV